MNNRESGYYHIKYDGDWFIGHYENNEWWIIGFHDPFYDSDLDEIDENMIAKHE